MSITVKSKDVELSFVSSHTPINPPARSPSTVDALFRTIDVTQKFLNKQTEEQQRRTWVCIKSATIQILTISVVLGGLSLFVPELPKNFHYYAIFGDALFTIGIVLGLLKCFRDVKHEEANEANKKLEGVRLLKTLVQRQLEQEILKFLEKHDIYDGSEEIHMIRQIKEKWQALCALRPDYRLSNEPYKLAE